jgi:hypothetical protein
VLTIRRFPDTVTVSPVQGISISAEKGTTSVKPAEAVENPDACFFTVPLKFELVKDVNAIAINIAEGNKNFLMMVRFNLVKK